MRPLRRWAIPAVGVCAAFLGWLAADLGAQHTEDIARAAVPRIPGPISRPAPPVGGADLAVRCGRLIDGRSDGVRSDMLVSIRGGVIDAVEPFRAAPAGVPFLDLSAATVLPGLIDMHTHLTDSPEDTKDLKIYFTRTREEALRAGSAHAAATLDAGFTTVRDVGTYIAWADRDLRDAIVDGHVPGPRMQVAGFYLTIPGGGGDLLVPGVAEKDIPPQLRQGVARGAETFRARAEAAVAGGADVLKVIASGAVLAYGGVPGAPEMTLDELRAVAEVAHAHGLKLAAHAHGAQSVREAILAGADTIEHASLIDADGLRLAHEHGVALSMDVYDGDYIDTEGRKQGWPEEFLRKNVETTEIQRQNFRKANEAGVPLVFGTDAAVYPHGLNARQFAYMVRWGMRPMDAIRAATSRAAAYLGWPGKVGEIVPGAFGDLIAVDSDPLADITELERVRTVVQGGRVVKGAAAAIQQ